MTSGLPAGGAAGAFVLLLGIRAAARFLPTRAGGDRTREVSMPTIRRRASRRPSDLAVAAWCDDMARDIRSGSSLTTAVRDSEAGHPGLALVTGPVVQQITRGQSLSSALRTAAADPATAVGLAVTVLRSCAELGGPAASPLERVAATLRDRDAIRQEQASHSAQARMSARVMTMVPVGMLGLLASTDSNVRSAVGAPAGLATVTTGAVLNVTGWWWMQRIIGRPR